MICVLCLSKQVTALHKGIGGQMLVLHTSWKNTIAVAIKLKVHEIQHRVFKIIEVPCSKLDHITKNHLVPFYFSNSK